MPHTMIFVCDNCKKHLQAQRCNADGENWLTLDSLKSPYTEGFEGGNALRLTWNHCFCGVICLLAWAEKAVEAEKELLDAVENIPVGQIRGSFSSKILPGVHLP